VRVIDLEHVGQPRVIGVWQVDDVVIDPGPSSGLPKLLEALGDDRPRALLLTHIHLDHAGATGSLVERWPDLEVYVHEVGAPHLIKPERLLESARRLYGDDMDRLWGEMVPVPERNLTVLSGGERLLGGRFEVAYTPGHASHHVSYRHDGTAFVGDVGGVRITPESLTIPPTPPPDVDVDAWHESIEKIRAWGPERLAFTHFGSSDDVEDQLHEVGRRLDEWAELARENEQDAFIGAIQSEIGSGTDSGWVESFKLAAAPEQMYAGLRRYWKKQAETLPPAGAPPVS
jgi:glyoxylase-like metal-dependent hydrolase (beta-lactamase superfamily II)